MFVEARVLAGEESLFQPIGHILDPDWNSPFFAKNSDQLPIFAEYPQRDLKLDIPKRLDVGQIRFKHQVGNGDCRDPEDRRNQGQYDQSAKQLLHTIVLL